MYDGNPGEIDFGSSYRESTVLYFKKGLKRNTKYGRFQLIFNLPINSFERDLKCHNKDRG